MNTVYNSEFIVCTHVMTNTASLRQQNVFSVHAYAHADKCSFTNLSMPQCCITFKANSCEIPLVCNDVACTCHIMRFTMLLGPVKNPSLKPALKFFDNDSTRITRPSMSNAEKDWGNNERYSFLKDSKSHKGSKPN